MSRLLVKTNVRYLTEVFEEKEGANLIRETACRRWMSSCDWPFDHSMIPFFTADNSNIRRFLGMWRNAAALQKPIYSRDFDFIHTDRPRASITMAIGYWDRWGLEETFIRLDRFAYSIEWAKWDDVPAPLIMASYGLPAILASGVSPITDELIGQSKFDGALLERVFANPRP